MHVPTGEILDLKNSLVEKLLEDRQEWPTKHVARLADRKSKMVALTEDETKKLLPLDKQKRKGWMRNQPCVCGSGKKFKRCCWSKFK